MSLPIMHKTNTHCNDINLTIKPEVNDSKLEFKVFTSFDFNFKLTSHILYQIDYFLAQNS
jgi:hypothetical protein